MSHKKELLKGLWVRWGFRSLNPFEGIRGLRSGVGNQLRFQVFWGFRV